MSMPI
ncbi:bfad9452-89d2-4406-81e9-f2d697246873 [Thermothielavioides terrestris]